METLLFSVASALPIFIIILLGMILRYRKVASPEFIRAANKIVFSFAMPVMVFQKMRVIEAVPGELFSGILLFLAATLLIIVFTWLLFHKTESGVRGSTVQGAYRGNLAIIAVAVVQNVISDTAAAYTLVLLAVTMPIYNLFAIIILGYRSGRSPGDAFFSVVKEVAKNPLIWGIVVGLLFTLFDIPVPDLIDVSLDYLSRLTLPLALICIGGSLQISNLFHGRLYWGTSVFAKLFLLPGLVYLGTSVFPVPHDMRAVLVICAGSPTAVASFIMAEGFGADARLAGEIVAISTILSMVTLSIWIWILL